DSRATSIYTLSLHDALPIYDLVGQNVHETKQSYALHLAACRGKFLAAAVADAPFELMQDFFLAQALHRDDEGEAETGDIGGVELDRKSTRLNSSHVKISYAV